MFIECVIDEVKKIYEYLPEVSKEMRKSKNIRQVGDELIGKFFIETNLVRKNGLSLPSVEFFFFSLLNLRCLRRVWTIISLVSCSYKYRNKFIGMENYSLNIIMV